MHVHQMPPWVPVPFEPAKKPVKPRKFFHTEESSESVESGGVPARPSSILDEEAENERTDVWA